MAASAAPRFASVLVGRDRLDAGEADFAAILQAKAARIDHLGDAAFALRLEGASRRGGRADARRRCSQREHDCRARRRLKFEYVSPSRACVDARIERVIPLSGKTCAKCTVCRGLPLRMACGMIAATEMRPQPMRRVDREALHETRSFRRSRLGAGARRHRGDGAGQASAETRRHPRHVRSLRRHHRPRQRDRRQDGGGGFRRRGAGPQDRDRRRRSSQQGRSCRQHRPRHVRQSGRRDDLRRGGVRDRARRRRDRQGAQQDHHVQRSGIDPPHQRGLRSLYRALCVRHLRAGQRHRACRGQAGPRHLVLPHRRLRLRAGSGKGHHQCRAEVRRQGAGQRPASAQHLGFLVLSCCRRRPRRPR